MLAFCKQFAYVRTVQARQHYDTGSHSNAILGRLLFVLWPLLHQIDEDLNLLLQNLRTVCNGIWQAQHSRLSKHPIQLVVSVR